MAIRSRAPCTMAMLFTAATTAAAAQPTAITCRAEFVYVCTTVCEVTPAPAEFSLDFKLKTGSYCRGSRCDDGRITVEPVSGQHDNMPYQVFSLMTAGSQEADLAGVLAEGGKLFHASGDIGNFTGHCEAR